MIPLYIEKLHTHTHTHKHQQPSVRFDTPKEDKHLPSLLHAMHTCRVGGHPLVVRPVP